MTLTNCSRKKKAKTAVAVVAIGACVIASVFDGYTYLFLSEDDGRSQSLRRGLLASDEQQIDWDEQHIAQIEGEIDMFQQEFETDAAGRRESVPFIYPWAQANLRPNTRRVEPTKETILFWHIPKVSIAERAWQIPTNSHTEPN
jgi:hypothetical protein